jgi:glycopeptide antibiotics resistance protein
MGRIMNELINLLAPAIRWGMPFAIVALIVCLIRKYERRKTTFWTLLLAYGGALIGETVLSGHKYALSSYQLVPFNSLMSGLSWRTVLLQLVLNIVLFIPLGVFLYIGKRKLAISVIIGFGVSLAIEIIEYITKTGVFDVDDLIMNTLGTLIGFVICSLSPIGKTNRR